MRRCKNNRKFFLGIIPYYGSHPYFPNLPFHIGNGAYILRSQCVLCGELDKDLMIVNKAFLMERDYSEEYVDSITNRV